MTLTLAPDHDRPVPRVPNLSARVRDLGSHYRKVRRRLDPCDATPFDAEPPLSVRDRIGIWLGVHRDEIEHAVAVLLFVGAIAFLAAVTL